MAVARKAHPVARRRTEPPPSGLCHGRKSAHTGARVPLGARTAHRAGFARPSDAALRNHHAESPRFAPHTYRFGRCVVASHRAFAGSAGGRCGVLRAVGGSRTEFAPRRFHDEPPKSGSSRLHVAKTLHRGTGTLHADTFLADGHRRVVALRPCRGTPCAEMRRLGRGHQGL